MNQENRATLIGQLQKSFDIPKEIGDYTEYKGFLNREKGVYICSLKNQKINEVEIMKASLYFQNKIKELSGKPGNCSEEIAYYSLAVELIDRLLRKIHNN